MRLKNKNWNPVFNKVIEIKRKYEESFGVVNNYNNSNEGTCIERWIEELRIEEYINLFEPLQITQFGTMLLIRYGKYSDVFGGEEDITYEEFWNAYDGFYLECRSVVIDIKNETLVLTPFKKFRNLNECEENSLENITRMIKDACCVEFSNKLDGSMQTARWFNGRLIMAGSMALDGNNSWRLADGYRMLNEDDNYVKMLKDNPDKTFIFEYISSKDAHVVHYEKSEEGLYLIGIRNVETGVESSYADISNITTSYNIRVTEIYDKTFEDVLKDVPVYKSNEKEGFVLNIDGYKVKIKCDDYVNMHRVLSYISSINLIIKNIADDTFDDMISKIPQSYRKRVLKIANVVFDYIREMDIKVKGYVELAPKISKKEFMLYISKNVPKEFQAYCREMYIGREVNYIKSRTNTNNPHYKKLNEMGVSDYTTLFMEDTDK